VLHEAVRYAPFFWLEDFILHGGHESNCDAHVICTPHDSTDGILGPLLRGDMETPDPRALEEWKQLQTIIGRLEGLEFQIRGWLLVLLGALIAALLSEKSRLTPHVFLIIGLTIVSIFCFMELTTRMPKRRAIHRARTVEQALQGNAEYNGPAIVANLSGDPSKRFKLLAREFLITNFLAFYVPLWILVAIIARYVR
jgi:hypothetical protein